MIKLKRDNNTKNHMEKGIQPIRGREDPIALIGFIETVVIYW